MRLNLLKWDTKMKLAELFEAVKTAHPKSGSSYLRQQVVELADLIRAEAGEMVKAYQLTNGYLYRGRTANSTPFIPIRIRPDRRPVDMQGSQHELLHRAFKEAGLQATRKNGIFCSTQQKIANDWGDTTTIIFVKDGWVGTVFDRLKNDYAYFALSASGQSEETEDNKIEAIKKDITRYGGRSFGTASELANIIDNEYADVIISGNSYYALDIKSPLTKRVLTELGLG